MGRPVVLSNGQLFVGLDEDGLVHDFYYPYVGLENLTNARSLHHMVGVWIDGQFSWTDDGSWDITVDFEEHALVSKVTFSSHSLGVVLRFQDFVDPDYNALVRHVTVTNQLPKERDLRIFMHQVFQISRQGRGDTAMYVPEAEYILDYKGRYCLLVSGKFEDGSVFDQYAVGNYGIEGKAGTFKDAEDGELSGNAVEHGGVDSVIRFQKTLSPGGVAELDYWVIAASSQTDAEHIHTLFKDTSMRERRHKTEEHWQTWLSAGDVQIPEFHRRSLERSLLVIKAHCDARGSVLASGDSSIFNYGRDYYCYCWPRDSAYALWPLIRLGHFEEARLFLEFARDTVHPDGYVMHKYQPDRAIGSTWHPLVHNRHKELAIQEDETAIVLFMIGEYLSSSQDMTFVENLFQSFIAPCADFMCRFVDSETGLPHASYDLWEEKFLTSTYTVCCVIAGLQTAARIAKLVESPEDHIRWKRAAEQMRDSLGKLYRNGYFIKGFLLDPSGNVELDETVDISSLYGPYMFAGLPIGDERIQNTAQKVEETILNATPSGGVLRYEHDSYFLTKTNYSGNPWVVSTLWLAQYFCGTNRRDKASDLLKWALDRQLPSGMLSEQFDPETAEPLGVTPLVWSHAEMVNTLLDLSTEPPSK